MTKTQELIRWVVGLAGGIVLGLIIAGIIIGWEDYSMEDIFGRAIAAVCCGVIPMLWGAGELLDP